VVGIGHGDWTRDEWQNWGLTAWHELDVSVASLSAHAHKPDVIIHCAGSGSVGFSIENPAQDFERTALTTLNVLEYVRTTSPRTRVVYPSTAAVYGSSTSLPLRIDSTLNPVSPYGVHKKAAEDLCRSFARNFRLNASIVRIFSAYGRELRKQLLWDACQKVRHGNFTFSGNGIETRDWVHVEDIAELLVCASEYSTPEVPTVNGATGVETATHDILIHLFDSLGETARPQFSGNYRLGDPDRYLGDPEPARQWSWSPKLDWRAGVRDYALWFMEQYP
jgi:UDP-glucose 4-epimerase